MAAPAFCFMINRMLKVTLDLVSLMSVSCADSRRLTEEFFPESVQVTHKQKDTPTKKRRSCTWNSVFSICRIVRRCQI